MDIEGKKVRYWEKKRILENALVEKKKSKMKIRKKKKLGNKVPIFNYISIYYLIWIHFIQSIMHSWDGKGNVFGTWEYYFFDCESTRIL